ncbi:MAG: hypothetical protein LBQ76_03375 [Candidatus Fibromonas sp.]|jgi:hypothetical protein|nr:hypothetical protein [Candidatus Fibromonas sp.]
MTDEELKSLVASLAEGSKETERQFQQLREAMDKRSKEIDLTIKKVDRQIDKVAKQMGGINENIGYHAEQFFQNAFEDNKVFGGIEYDDIILNMGYKSKTEKVEFDIVLENGNSVALIEIKNRIHPDFVKKLAEERIDKFRKYFPMYKGYDIYLGIAGFSFSEEVLKEAKKYGVGIIRQVGESIEIDATGLVAYH